MNRKLVVLNVALVGAVVYAGMEGRRQWVAAKERQAEIQRRGQVAPAPAPPFTRQPEVQPVLASGYANIAQRFLLDPSRNPDVPIEKPPAPPPPPPRPPLPFFHGMMNIGDGPEVSMSATANAVHKWLHAGEKIGEFKLVAFDAENIELEWNGDRIIKSLTELSGHSAQGQAIEPPPDNDQPPTRVIPPPAPVGPGPENVAGERSCQANDTMPVGTVVNGVIKTIVRNPLFGSENCIWKPVGR